MRKPMTKAQEKRADTVWMSLLRLRNELKDTPCEEALNDAMVSVGMAIRIGRGELQPISAAELKALTAPE